MGYSDEDEEDDLAALFVLGDMYENEKRSPRGGGCLPTSLLLLCIPLIIGIFIMK